METEIPGGMAGQTGPRNYLQITTTRFWYKMYGHCAVLHLNPQYSSLCTCDPMPGTNPACIVLPVAPVDCAGCYAPGRTPPIVLPARYAMSSTVIAQQCPVLTQTNVRYRLRLGQCPVLTSVT
eukprot:523060-Rhodomonas_salina.4